MEPGRKPHLQWQAFADFPAAELYELLRFRQAIFVVEQASPYADLDGLDQAARHLTLRAGSELVACLRLVPGGDRVRIGRLAVAPEWRGRGVARGMMDEALAACRRDSPGRRIALSAQAYLRAFYEKLGFVAVSPEYDDFGVPNIDMERQ